MVFKFSKMQAFVQKNRIAQPVKLNRKRTRDVEGALTASGCFWVVTLRHQRSLSIHYIYEFSS